MTTERIKPDCRIEIATAGDIIDGLETLKGRSGQGTILRPPGRGPDEPLAWAISEVTAAAVADEEAEVSKLCTNAVMNSRRALACLVDWYIDRDLAKYCKNPPATPKQQAQFLMSRGIIDELTSHVLERAVGKRNRVEHEYVVPTLAEAEDVVELLRRTMATLRSQSDPSLARCSLASSLVVTDTANTEHMQSSTDGLTLWRSSVATPDDLGSAS